jgi:hypothetical protein
VGIVVTGFCYPGGILQLSRRQDQQILRLPTAARISHLGESSSSTARSICRYLSKKSFKKIDSADTAGDTWSKDLAVCDSLKFFQVDQNHSTIAIQVEDEKHWQYVKRSSIPKLIDTSSSKQKKNNLSLAKASAMRRSDLQVLAHTEEIN